MGLHCHRNTDNTGNAFASEEELQEEAIKLLKKPENKYAYLICSSTNMESLASFHEAVLAANAWNEKQGCYRNRAMYVNFYVEEQMKLFASVEPHITKEFAKVYHFEPYGKYKIPAVISGKNIFNDYEYYLVTEKQKSNMYIKKDYKGKREVVSIRASFKAMEI